jgi:hypothetical protein
MGTDGGLRLLGAFIREPTESYIEYKLALKQGLSQLASEYGVVRILYEEPFSAINAKTSEALYIIDSVPEELAVESGGALGVWRVNNKRWKKWFLGGKLEGNSATQKQLVAAKCAILDKRLVGLGNDETDAYGLACYFVDCVRNERLELIRSAGKPKKFKYVVTLLGGRLSATKALEATNWRPRPCGEYTESLERKRDFSAQVYRVMRKDDATLVLWFKRGQFGDLILSCEAGLLAKNNDWLTAVVQRASKFKSIKQSATAKIAWEV